MTAQLRQAFDPVVAQQNNRQSESEPAHQIHRQGTHRVGLGFSCLLIANQQKGAQRCDFPEKVKPVQAVGENDTEHRTQKNKERDEKHRATVTILGMVVLVKFLHIPWSIDTNQAADNTDHQHHDHGKLVTKDPWRNSGNRFCHPCWLEQLVDFKTRHQKELRQEQPERQPIFRLDRNPDNETGDQRLDHEHAPTDGEGRTVQKGRVRIRLQRQKNRSSHDRGREGIYRIAPHRVARDK